MTSGGPRKNAGKTPSGSSRGKPFVPGNPGRPRGARNRSTVAIEVLLEGEAEAIGRVCVERALEGDATALRLAMERIAPVRKGRPVRFPLPALDAAADLPRALRAVLAAVADGAVTPDEGLSLAQIIETRRRTFELVELEQRIAALEKTRDTER